MKISDSQLHIPSEIAKRRKGRDDIITEIVECLLSWEPDTRVLGNVRACDAAAEIAALRQRAEKAEARVATREAECVAWRENLALGNLQWYYGHTNECSQRHAKASRDLHAARAATGPLPAKETT